MPSFAPRENQPIVGYWGKPTSTLDFCEENYVVNLYMAEFCKFSCETARWLGFYANHFAGNTITNASTVILPLVGAVISWRTGLERRYTASYILLTGEDSGEGLRFVVECK